MKITAVLLVEEIEKSLPFWVERMGFEKTVEVPEGDRLGFVILAREGAELMLQTIESVRKDAPQFVPKAGTSVAALFIEVDDFADTVRRLEGYAIALARAHNVLWHARDRRGRAGRAYRDFRGASISKSQVRSNARRVVQMIWLGPGTIYLEP